MKLFSFAFVLTAFVVTPVFAQEQSPTPTPTPSPTPVEAVPYQYEEEGLPEGYEAEPVPQEYQQYADAPTDQVAFEQGSPLPLVYVPNISITSAENNVVRGTFEVLNGEDVAVSNLTHQFLVLEPLPEIEPGIIISDTGSTYFRSDSTESFSLAPGERRTIPFEVTVPPVPDGGYRLQIKLRTVGGHGLGWKDANVRLGGAQSFVVVDPSSVEIQSIDVGTGEAKSTWQPLEGPNVDPGARMELVAQVRSSGGGTVSAVPMLTVRSLLSSDASMQTIQGQPVVVNGGEGQEVRLPLTAELAAGPYAVYLSFADATGNSVSGEGEFRYVVRGPSASIAKQAIESLGSARGNTTVVAFTVAGSADRDTTVSGTLEATLSDDSGIVGVEQNELTLEAGDVVQGKASIVSDRNLCGTPSVLLTMRAADGTVLASSLAQYPELRVENCGLAALITPRNMAIVGGALLLLVAIITSVFLLRRRGSKEAIPPVALFVLGTALTFAGLFGMNTGVPEAEANGITYRYCDEKGCPTLYVNSPTHESTINNNETLQYQASYSFVSCANNVVGTFIRVYVDEKGGKNEWNVPPAQRHPTRAVFSSTSPVAGFTNWAQIGGTYREIVTSGRYGYNYYGNLTLPEVFADNTTLWTHAFGGWGATAYDFTWLNFNRPAECSDGIDNDEDGVSDAQDAGCFTDPTDPETYDPEIEIEGDPPAPECSDSTDNDGDGDLDSQDPGCWTHPTDPTTYDPNDPDEDDDATPPECSDNIENDQDGLIDEDDPGCWVVPSDPSTYNPNDPNEDDSIPNEVPECSDNIDNDGDATVDSEDPGCWTDPTDPTTYDPNDPDEDENPSPTATPAFTPSATPTSTAIPSSSPGPGGNQLPVAVITTQATFQGEQVVLSGAQSSDPDGTIVNYLWSIRDPRGNPVTVGSTVQESFTGNLEGNYIVTLTVTDNGGAQDSVSTSVPVYNTAPVADIQGSASGTQINLDGSGSYDPDAPKDSIAGYAWVVKDAGGNTVAVNGANQANASFDAQPQTVYEVRLTVTDTKGKTGAAVQDVTTGSAGSAPTFSPGQLQEVD